MFTKLRYSNVSLLSLLIHKVRLETDREIHFLVKVNVDIMELLQIREMHNTRQAPQCFPTLRNYHMILLITDSTDAYIKTKFLVSQRS